MSVKRRKKVKKKKWARKFWLSVLGVLGVLLFIFAGWVLYLDRMIIEQFEGRRWTVPAQVFAQPLELYVGQVWSVAELANELHRLGYQQVNKPQRPGSYTRSGNRIDLIARAFHFWDEARPAQALSVVVNNNAIEGMFDSAGHAVPLYRLDPLLIGSIFPIHGEDRIIVTPAEVPAILPAALKVVEDRRFDTHFGVDPMGILRALWVNIRSGHFAQGASTLTQQLVRSYFLTNQQTLQRKITEAIMAILLEIHFDKTDLMNAYINEINLGQDGDRAVHGFGLASQFYFGKPLNELQLHEIALLVTEVRSPSYYNPLRHPQRAKARRDLILNLLAQFKVISLQQAQRAQVQPLGLSSERGAGGSYYPAFLDFVRRTLRRDYQEADLTEAGLKVFTTLDPRVQTKAEQALMNELARLDKRVKHTSVPLEGAVIVTAPQSGEVSAIVGGRQVGFSGFNRALDARRSLGSLAKPVIYLAALETGRYHAASVLNDQLVTIDLGGGKTWTPKNYAKVQNGPVSLVRALSDSLNLATVNLGMDIGLGTVAHEFLKLGFESEPPQLPAILLGGFEASPMAVAQLYNSLANGGFKTPLRAVRAVVDAAGTPLQAFPLEVTQVADPVAVYQVNRMLVQVMQRGTGRAARARLPADLVVAGKTGTSSDYRDSWFAGFSGSHLSVVWVGFDDNKPTGLSGASGALAVWSQLMGSIQTNGWAVPLPEDLTEVAIDYPSGLKADATCSQNLLTIAVPRATELPLHAGCGSVGDVIKNAGRWLRNVMKP